jgi:hypothetical protein
MAPSEKKLTTEIKAEVRDCFNNPKERPALTVRYIRTKLEKRLGLGDGFFVVGAWKEKSKTLIKNYAVSFALRLLICSTTPKS